MIFIVNSCYIYMDIIHILVLVRELFGKIVESYCR